MPAEQISGAGRPKRGVIAFKRDVQRILYITYDGILEPLGYSQVFKYLKGLAPGREIFLLSFEKPEEWKNVSRRQRLESEIAAAGIRWVPVGYHRRPSALATSYDLIQGIAVGLWLVKRHRIRLVHARSYVAATIALSLKRACGTNFIFDMRGFWADERVDAVIWPRDSRLYRIAKGLERKFLTRASTVVSLTQAGVREMRTFGYLHGRKVNFAVIPTCVDSDSFRPANRRTGSPFTLGYVGAAGLWYDLAPAVECFRIMLSADPAARVLILNRGEHQLIRDALERGGVPIDRVELSCADPDAMPAELAKIDASVFFIRPFYSKKASAPTKLGELLAAGVPCLTGAGIGDVDEIITRERVGIVAPTVERGSLRDALGKLLELAREPGISERCRAAAMHHFSLDSGVRAYARLYDTLAGS